VKETIKQVVRYRELKALYQKYERALIPGTLVFGVIVDSLTFRSINIETAFFLLLVYAVVAGAAIGYINTYDARAESSVSAFRYLRLAMPLVIQFSFGALLSASLIFYWFSGAFSVSWPIIFLIALLMVSNDVFRHYYLRPGVQVSVYFFILFSLASVMLPYVLNSMSAWIFVLAGVASLGLIAAYLRLFGTLWSIRRRLATPIAVIFVGMNMLYFFNLIPPIPLSLREAGVYHHVERADGDYRLLSEKESFFADLLPGTTIHVGANEPVFVFSAVFAPADLNTRIVHRWQRYDEERDKWVSVATPSFPLIGGRGDGYRGFSQTSNASPGKWRVDVETVRGQVLGRVRFRVERPDEPIEREIIIR
jgi:hypothetical protein